MKTTAIETVGAATISKMVVRSCGDARDMLGRKVWRSCTTYTVKANGRVDFATSLGAARELAAQMVAK